MNEATDYRNPPTPTQSRAEVVENVRLARDTYRVRLAEPEIARQIVPGQFVMLRLPDHTDPLLGRAFALYDTYMDDAGRPVGIDIVYLVIGKVTGLMAGLRPGDGVILWGPLGNGFAPATEGAVWMVAGGIGQTPFLALAREALGLGRYGSPPRPAGTSGKVTLCYGVRSAELLAGVADFDAVGVDVRLATDDGSAGRRGFVTDLVAEMLRHDRPDRIVGCGPEPMMAALARLATEHQVPCELSLETPMACGIGACCSCVARIRTGPDDWDYRRVCVGGPVFDAARVLF